MSLRIIKRGVSKTTAIHPFFFTEGHTKGQPELYILPEAAQEVGIPEEEPELPEVIEESAAPAIDVEQLEKDAFERGYAEGRDEGLNEGRNEGMQEGLKVGETAAAAQIEEMSRYYTDSLAEVAALKDTLRDQVEEEVVRLALAVAKKVVHREIHIDPTIIHALVRVALERVSGKTAVTVRLCPTDYEYMTSKHGDMSRAEGREINFEPDTSITQGGCMIQTEIGDIDARIEEELREVEGAFFEGL